MDPGRYSGTASQAYIEYHAAEHFYCKVNHLDTYDAYGLMRGFYSRTHIEINRTYDEVVSGQA